MHFAARGAHAFSAPICRVSVFFLGSQHSPPHFLPALRPTAVDATKSEAAFMVVGGLLYLLRELSCRRDLTENTTKVEEKLGDSVSRRIL